MRFLIALVGLGCAALVGGCASAPMVKPISEQASIAVAGPRCASGACTCRVVDDFGRGQPPGVENEGEPPAGLKRFELRTGRGLDPESITVEGAGTLHKSTSDAGASCAYVDLAPGKHRVHVHATAANGEAGMVPALFIRELGVRAKDWYDTFAFRCGGTTEPCNLGDMQAWVDEVQKVPRGIHDPCGSVRVEGVRWEGGRASGVKLGELDVDLVLEIYKFSPRFPHGHKTCRGLDPTTKAEEDAEKQ